MNRREFLGWVGVGGVASYLPVALIACSSKHQQTNNPQSPACTPTPTPRSDGFGFVGTVSELEQGGQILNKQFSAGSVLVIRYQAEFNQIRAVNPTCPHQACDVNWKQEQSSFVCP